MICEGRLACALLVGLVAALAIVGFTPAPARAAHSPTGLTVTPAGCTSVVPAWDSPAGGSLAGWDYQHYQVVGAPTAFEEIAELPEIAEFPEIADSGAATTPFTVTGLTAGTDYATRLQFRYSDGASVTSRYRSVSIAPTCPTILASINGQTRTAHPSVGASAPSGGQTGTAATPEDPEIHTVAPTCVGGDVDGTAVTLTFSEPLETTAVPSPAHFTLTADGRSFSPHSIEVNGATVTMTLHADDAVTIGQSVTATYHASTNPDERLQDPSGNFVAACSSKPVQNHTTVPWIPVPVDSDWSSNPYDGDWASQSNPCDQPWSSNPFDTPGSGPSPGQVVCPVVPS